MLLLLSLNSKHFLFPLRFLLCSGTCRSISKYLLSAADSLFDSIVLNECDGHNFSLFQFSDICHLTQNMTDLINVARAPEYIDVVCHCVACSVNVKRVSLVTLLMSSR